MPSFFGDGNTPRRSDPSWVVLQKILGSLTGSGGTGGLGTTQVYQDRAPAAPDDPAKAAISYASADQVISQWNGSAWV